MKKTLFSLGTSLLLITTLASPALAASKPETRSGLILSVFRLNEFHCETVKNTVVKTHSSTVTISKGISKISMTGIGSACISQKLFAVWGYTGSGWGQLGTVSTKSATPYLTSLPASLLICKGSSNAVVKSGPGMRFTTVGTVTSTQTVAADLFKLEAKAVPLRVDGRGWYRIKWRGKPAWVASYQVANAAFGCTNWAAYWADWTHR